ncbi:MAG: PAS domain S-box protein [Anaerolineae bacterium]|nr:PAS domain S-box protein [Anaerolineae bacterium]
MGGNGRRQPSGRSLAAREGRARQWAGLDLATLLERMPIGLLWFDQKGCIKGANPAAAHLLGKEPAEILGEFHFQVGYHLCKEDGQPLSEEELAEFHRALGQGQVEERILVVDAPGAKPRWAKFVAMPLYSSEGELRGSLVVFDDITPRVQAEQGLQRSEARFRGLFETLTEGVILFSPQGHIKEMNPAAARILGLEEALEGQQHFGGLARQLFWPDGRPLTSRELAELRRRAKRGALEEMTLGIQRLDGHLIWVRLNAFLLGDLEGRTEYIVLTFRDVTEQKRAEEELRHHRERLEELVRERTNALWAANVQLRQQILERERVEAALRESEARYRALFDSANDAILLLRGEAFVDCNPKALELFGASREEIIGRTPFDFSPPQQPDGHDSLAWGRAKLQAAFAGEPQCFEWRHLRKDGTPFDAEISLNRVKVGADAYLQAIVRDVSARKQAEEELRRSREFLRLILDTDPNCIFVKDSEGRFLLVNQAMAELWGIPVEEMEGMSEWELAERLHLPKEQVERFLAEDQQVLQAGKRLELPVSSIRDPQGRARWFYTIKEPLSFRGRERHVLGISVDITEQRAAEAALRESEARYRTLFEASIDAIFVVDMDGHILDCNTTACALYGYTKEEFRRLKVAELAPPETVAQARGIVDELFRKGTVLREMLAQRKDGSTFPAEVSVRVVTIGGQRVVIGYVHDLTERRRLEGELRQAQKMEAIGRLAGGVAHDFNNILTVINGYSDLVYHSLEAGDPLRQDVEEIRKAGRRAAELTQQLLAFSRRHKPEMASLDLNEVLVGMAKMLRRIIGEDIELDLRLAHSLPPVEADRGYLEQMIINLAANARDAMPKGGVLTLETASLQGEGCPGTYMRVAKPGPCVRLTVRDTGVGMNDEVKEHLFEPFYTTKEPGKGTGLGLAMVYGIIQQLGGGIDLLSAPGKGTTFRIYLPCSSEPLATSAAKEEPKPLPRGSETILVVEDQGSVRRFVAGLLERLGYTVLQFSRPQEVLDFCRSQEEKRADLLLTDVVMPEMSGPELVAKLREEYGPFPVLYMSGYAERVMEQHGGLPAEDELISKPFSLEKLAHAVRRALEGQARDGG